MATYAQSTPPNLIYYGSALAAIALIPGAQLPPALAVLAGGVGVNALSSILERIVKGENVADEEIREQVERAINATNIDQLLKDDSFQRSLAQLVRRLDLLKYTVVDGDRAIMQQLADQYSQHQTMLIELRDLINNLKAESAKSRRPAANMKPRVFISYARKDGQDFAGDLRERLLDEGIPLWQDRVGMEGGRDWWHQITEAIDNVEFMVLVMTPAALKSDVIRREWRYARVQGVCVYPVKGVPDGELDYKSVPKWMRDVHWYDLDHEWQKFVNDLNTKCQVRRVPFMVENLPEMYVKRPKALEEIISQLLDEKREEPVAITAALRGAGGFGKTTLARAICHDERIQQAFDDGILWVTLGENVQLSDLIGKVLDLIETLSGERPSFTGLEAATARLMELFEDRDILLVIDDLWQAGDTKPFLQGGKGVARLITTRDDGVLPQKASRIVVESMETSEAVQLLTAGLQPPREAMRDLQMLAVQLGEWALVLKLVNGVLNDRIARGQTLTQALGHVQKTLQKRGMFGLNLRETEDRRTAASATLQLSIELLKPQERERFIELAVFPEDMNIPLQTVARLWSATGGMDEIDTEELCIRLFEISLLLNLDLASQSIRLHDVVRHFLRSEAKARLPQLNANLLDSFKLSEWHKLPESEPYLWDWLAYHLTEAGREHELITTVKDLYYLAKKTALKRSYSVESDLLIAERQTTNDSQLHLLRRTYVNSMHLFYRCTNSSDILNVLYWRLKSVEASDSILHLTSNLLKPRLEPFISLSDLPHPNLIRTLSGHSDRVLACAISSDSRFIVSASKDHTLSIWDSETGREKFILDGHSDGVLACAISSNDRFVVSASGDNTLRVWDSETGQERFNLSAHYGGVQTCAISPDSRFIVAGAGDGTVRVWDSETGQERFNLSAHYGGVRACAISSDNRFIVSASDDSTVRVWDSETGRNRFTLWGHADYVLACAISPDNHFIVSASGDNTLRVWDSETGRERFILEGHSDYVSACAISLNNQFIVSASGDRTLKVWDSETGREQFTLQGHSDYVSACAVSSNDRFVVSASADNTLRVWDSETGQTKLFLEGHTDIVRACEISSDNRFIVSASADETLRVWDSETGREGFTLRLDSEGMRACAISFDNRFIIAGTENGTVSVWDSETGRIKPFLGQHTDGVMACAISSDNRFIVSASADNTLRVWDSENRWKSFTLYGHSNWVVACAISSDNRFIVSASDDETIRVWDSETGQEKLVLRGHSSWVRACAISSDNRFIVSASDDNTLRVWDSKTGREQFILQGHSEGVQVCSISPDDRFILSGSSDNTVKVWDVVMGKCLATFYTEGAVTCVKWFNYDYRIVAGSASGHMYFLRFVL